VLVGVEVEVFGVLLYTEDTVGTLQVDGLIVYETIDNELKGLFLRVGDLPLQ
jgi:hypothetical protein